MDSQPNKSDIEVVFQRLRAIPANKSCFDCGAKNPTWSSVTYGVFICIDCSAVHRSLGVHLSFVRSTQLDTNWTWIQLRQMQLGGNSNATQFFNQHNCITNDAQKKYNSRAAQLYRDKLTQLATNSLKIDTQLNSTLNQGAFFLQNKLHIAPHIEENWNEEKEVDFFQEHENFQLPNLPEQHLSNEEKSKVSLDNNEEGPKIDFTTNAESVCKSTITARKPAPKKVGLGTKKLGLGATKVKTNFAQLEREAELAEEARQKALEESAKAAALSIAEQEEREAAIRLAYKDLGAEQLKKEEQIKKQDPKKAEQFERLGMGVSTREGISHSAISNMQQIEQEHVQPTPSTLSSLGKLLITDSDNLFDDYSYNSNFNMNRNNYSTKLDSFSETNNSRDNWVIIDDPPIENNKSRSTITKERKEKSHRLSTTPTSSSSSSSNTDEARKKFGNAKAISSDQYFNNNTSLDYETKTNLNRFQGSSSISSAEFFGNEKDNIHHSVSNSPLQNYDLDDVKESVKLGVTKVAGKLSSLANDVMSSLQDRYGY